MMVQATDLDSFNKNETRKQQEADFASRPADANGDPQSFNKQISDGTQSQQSNVGSVNPCQARLNKTHAPSEDIDLPVFYALDNKLVEVYCASRHTLLPEEQMEVLEADEFLHFSRRLLKELSFVFNLEFVKFWAQVTKNDQVILFMDDFLQNVRKYNDIEKLLEQTVGKNSQERPVDLTVKESFQYILEIVLKIFYRMSQISESEDSSMNIGYYQELVYNNWLFDMAKLYDISAVYGESNNQVVKQIISNVFDNDMRYVEDFKESVDVIINMFKKSFGTSLKVNEMVAGNDVFQKSRDEQDQVIEDVLLDFVDLMNNVELIIKYFPDQMLETVRNTSMTLFMANTYCLMHKHARQWLKQSNSADKLNSMRKTLKKLAFNNCLQILEKAIINNISQPSKNYAIVQDRLGKSLKQFILGTTGNVELSKEILHKNSNFISDSAKTGNGFIKKILLTVDVMGSLSKFEERFMDKEDKQFLGMIIKSIQKGSRVQVVKNQSQMQSSSNNDTKDNEPHLSMQDKENIKSIMDMFNGQYRNERVRDVYLQNNKNFEQTLDLFLTGNLPEEQKELKVIITQNDQKKQQQESEQMQINTMDNQGQNQSSQQQKAKLPVNKEELQAYVMDKYRDVLFGKKKNVYEQNHQRAMQLKEQEERESDIEVRKKILSLASEMQYDDDADESQVQIKHKKVTAVTNDATNQRNYRNNNKNSKDQSNPDNENMDDDNEDLVDVAAAFVEAQTADAKEATQDYLFEEDRKSKQRRQEQPDQQKPQNKQGQQSQNNKQVGKNNQNKNKEGNEEMKRKFNDKEQRRDGRIDNRKQRDRVEHDERQQRADKFDNRGSRGRGYGGGRGGYRDDYQRESLDSDRAYTTKNPLDGQDVENRYDRDSQRNTNNEENKSSNQRNDDGQQRPQNQNNQNSRGRGGQSRGGRGGQNNQNKRGGAHNQKNQAAKKNQSQQQQPA